MQVQALENAVLGNEMDNIYCKQPVLAEGDASGDSERQCVSERGTAGRQERETGNKGGKGEQGRRGMAEKEKGNVSRRFHADGYQGSCGARGCCATSPEQHQAQMPMLVTHLKPFSPPEILKSGDD